MVRRVVVFVCVVAVSVCLMGCPKKVSTPDVVEMTQAAAAAAITGAGLTVGAVTQENSPNVPAGSIISQNPVAGASVSKGTAVSLVISLGPLYVTVPNTAGMTQAAATAAITNAGLNVGSVTQQPHTTAAIGTVISQDPANGTLAQGSNVNLVVSTGWMPAVSWTYQPDSTSTLGVSIATTSDNGVVIGGGHNSTYDLYGLKLTPAGQLDWAYIYSKPSDYGTHSELWFNEARDMRQTPDGGYAILSSGDLDDDGLPSPAYLLVKTDSEGDVEWSKTYSPDNPYSAGQKCVINHPGALDVTTDGGYVIFGSSYVGMYSLASIVKTDGDGNVEFNKVIDQDGRDNEQIIEDGQQTMDGGYVMCGHGSNGSEHGYLAILIKLAADGALEFSRTYQYTAGGYGAEAYGMTQTSDGCYVMGGELINSITKALTHGCWFQKVDAAGDILWTQYYAHGQETLHYPLDFVETPQGDILAVGSNYQGYMALSKYTASGILIWNFVLDNLPGGTAKDLTLTSDGGCVIVGSGVSSGCVVVKIARAFVPVP